MTDLLDDEIIGREFELQFHYYVHFRARKGMAPLIRPENV